MNYFRRIKLFGGLALALAMVMTYQQSVGAKADQPAWEPPLDAPLELVRPYRQPASDYSAGHRGVDYRVTPGQTIYSPADGTIYFNATLVNRPVLSIRSQNGDLIEFEPACGDFLVGTEVSAGQAIGAVCEPEASYLLHCDSCLHFSLRTERGYLSPIVRMGALAPSVLLPRF